MSKYFVHDVFNSDVEYFDTEEEAFKHVEESIGDGSDGWAQEILDGAIKIGIVTHESSPVNERETENKEWDFECECEMSEINETFAIFAGECGVDVSGCFDEDDCKEQIKVQMENYKFDMKEFEKENNELKNQLSTLQEQLDEAVDTLKFYEFYSEIVGDFEEEPVVTVVSFTGINRKNSGSGEIHSSHKRYGKRAREFLAKIKKEKEEEV